MQLQLQSSQFDPSGVESSRVESSQATDDMTDPAFYLPTFLPTAVPPPPQHPLHPPPVGPPWPPPRRSRRQGRVAVEGQKTTMRTRMKKKRRLVLQPLQLRLPQRKRTKRRTKRRPPTGAVSWLLEVQRCPRPLPFLVPPRPRFPPLVLSFRRQSLCPCLACVQQCLPCWP